MTGFAPPPPPSARVAPAVPGEAPLWAPQYGASFGQAFTRFWKKYARFDGRASRSEYWWWILAYAAISVGLYVLALVLGLAGSTPSPRGTGSVPGPAFAIAAVLIVAWYLGTLVPVIALVVRRLHDANFSGWFYLLNFVPVGNIVVLVFMFLESNPAGARFDRPVRG